MADDQISVRISADASAVAPGTNAAKDQIEGLTKTVERMGAATLQATAQMKTAMAGVADSIQPLGAEAQRATVELGRMTKAVNDNHVSAGQMKFAMRDLSFQVNDVATMFALGAPPMQVFASQGGQVIGALQMMTAESKGLLGFLGGPWGMVITSAALVLTPLIAKLFDTGDAAKSAAREVYGLKQALADIAGMKGMEALGNLNTKVLEARGALNKAMATPMQSGSGEAGRASADTANSNRDRAIADAKAKLAEAQSEFRVAQLAERNKTTQDDATDRARADKSGGGRVSRSDGGRSSAGSGSAAAEAAREEREATQIIIAQYNLRMEEAKGDMRKRLELATQEADFLKGKYGAQSVEYFNAQAAIVRIKREAAAQLQQIEEENAKAQDGTKLAAIDDAQAEAQAQLQSKQITNTKMLELDRQFEAQRFAVRNAALARQRATIDPTRDPVRYAQINTQIAALEQQHQNRLNQIERTAALQRTAFQRQSIMSLSQTWAQSIGQMLTLQTGFMTGIRSLWQGFQQFVANILAQIVQQWLVQHGVMTAIGKLFGIHDVATSAGRAGAAAYASTAAIPIIGPALAPAAAATAIGGALAAGSIAIAEGGDWQVREGLYQLHKDEMVLPAWAASPLRSMIASGNAPARPANDIGGGGKGMSDIHLNVNAMDVRGVKRFLMDNKEHVAGALRKHLRDGGR